MELMNMDVQPIKKRCPYRCVTTGVYLITVPQKKALYVGATVNIPERLRKHRYELRNNRHANTELQNYFNNLGEDAIGFTVFAKTDCQDEALLIETKVIDLLWDTGNLLNERGKSWTEEELRLKARAADKRCYYKAKARKLAS